MGDWACDLDGDYKIIGPTWWMDGKGRLDSADVAKLFDEHFDDLIRTRFGDDAVNMLLLVFDIDTDAYQAVADAFEHGVREGKGWFGIKKLEE